MYIFAIYLTVMFYLVFSPFMFSRIRSLFLKSPELFSLLPPLCARLRALHIDLQTLVEAGFQNE